MPRTLWHAAALGLTPEVEDFLAAPRPRHQTTSPRPSGKRATAGSGGARSLLASGADPDATPGYSDQTAAQIAAAPGTQRENLIAWLHDRPQ